VAYGIKAFLQMKRRILVAVERPRGRKPGKPPGPPSERLRIGGRWETAAGRAVRRQKPPGGWPKRPKRKKPP